MGGTWKAKAGVGPMKGGGCHTHLFTDTFGSVFFKNNMFWFENDYFSHTWLRQV